MYIPRNPRPGSSSRRVRRLVAAGLPVILVASCLSLHPAGARAESERAIFHLSAEFHGPHGYTDPAAAMNLQHGMANMIAFWPPANDDFS